VNPARVKKMQDRRRYFAGLYRDARAETIRETEKLLRALRGGASLRRIHFVAYDAHMAAGLLYGHAAWMAEARMREAAAKAGKRGPRLRGLSDMLGWPEPHEVHNARLRAQRRTA
jgi:hypothetical protein